MPNAHCLYQNKDFLDVCVQCEMGYTPLELNVGSDEDFTKIQNCLEHFYDEEQSKVICQVCADGLILSSNYQSCVIYCPPGEAEVKDYSIHFPNRDMFLTVKSVCL